MTILSTASTRDASWSRRLPHFPSADMKDASLRPMPLGAAVPPAWTSIALAVDDPPLGRILVVEDEAVVALDLQQMLRDAGFRVAGPAATLGDIQRLIDRGSVDCAILDLDVDRRTPLPVADLLAFADVPFVLLTGSGRVDLPRPHAHRPLLRKPVDRADLLAAIDRAMGRRSAAANDNRLTAGAVATAWPRVFPAL